MIIRSQSRQGNLSLKLLLLKSTFARKWQRYFKESIVGININKKAPFLRGFLVGDRPGNFRYLTDLLAKNNVDLVFRRSS
jgi:hypothetical protein